MASSDGKADPEGLSVCLCTFRRPQVVDTLRSLTSQSGPAFRLIVVDNDDTPSAQATVAACLDPLGVDYVYVHAPARNISIARNAAIDTADTRWAAFIDDDEIAPPGWLERLWTARFSGEAVFGPVKALYGQGAPGWAQSCDFHSIEVTRDRHGIATGHTCNVLFDLAFVRAHGLRFATALGRTGGEDSVFFMQMKDAGGRLAEQPDAVVLEHVARERLSMRWVLRRRWRAGQTHALMMGMQGVPAPKLAASAAAKAALCGGLAVVTGLVTARARWWLARATLHAGVLSYLANGNRLLEEYSSAPTPSARSS